eukprot:scaffold19118_cov129-Isochrysis_galbana.AAC.3
MAPASITARQWLVVPEARLTPHDGWVRSSTKAGARPAESTSSMGGPSGIDSNLRSLMMVWRVVTV